MTSTLQEYLIEIANVEEKVLTKAFIAGGENRYVLSGHFAFTPIQPSVWTRKITWITMLRNPIDRLRATFLWKVNTKSNDPNIDFELERRRVGPCGCGGGIDFEGCLQMLVSDPRCREALPFNASVLLVENPVTLICGSTKTCLEPNARFSGVPSNEALVKAKQNLENRYIVGLVERFKESLGLFACQLPEYFGFLDPDLIEISETRRSWIWHVKNKYAKNQQQYEVKSNVSGILDRARNSMPALRHLLEVEEALYKKGEELFQASLGQCELS